ncbi:uncharacterized protein EI90DRAFT_3019905 [Cantharellus anzutake]|uniref:uncharacterized protein n=1 Tax=Cantharellus anzutake TaxID=1750568 RepID=UPI0019035CF7|nr:uncharacterized protein EI90DRAFT_3019905 [Cantharellus anzutake]KAF8322978.1 hypothetical protein EI90DRAFT_3019905 [Cantharellus anzutake]
MAAPPGSPKMGHSISKWSTFNLATSVEYVHQKWPDCPKCPKQNKPGPSNSISGLNSMAPRAIPTVVQLKTIKFGPEIELEGPGLFHFGYFGQFGHFWWICPQEVAKLNVDHLLMRESPPGGSYDRAQELVFGIHEWSTQVAWVYTSMS